MLDNPDRSNQIHQCQRERREILPGNILIAGIESRRVLDLAKRLAQTDHTVLIVGETGVGKDFVARYLHFSGRRSSGPFVTVNCGAIPESLFESECFGHMKGAFTDASTTYRGYFEQAHGGTLFLDEVSALPLPMQSKLLRAVESKEFKRIGSETTVRTDIRIVAATNVDLNLIAREGRFRPDLLYRLSVAIIRIRPLRERQDELDPLAEHFLIRYGGNKKTFSEEAMTLIKRYDWPGNIRELEASIVRAVVSSGDDPVLRGGDLGIFAARAINAWPETTLGREIKQALTLANGSIKGAAKLLGIHRNTLYYRIRKLEALHNNRSGIDAASSAILREDIIERTSHP